mmetsp:Transcript_67586/g.119894  ORF Transcript_67586/g.119894 Transcript_67586/m.119894 type:complete len:617 (-) Transcript_67586:1213-3063(-)
MGCGASQAMDKHGGAKPYKATPGENADATNVDAEVDPKYAEALSKFTNVFAIYGKSSPALAGVIVDGTVTFTLLTATGEVYSRNFDRLALKTLKQAKCSWSNWFKQVKHQLKKAGVKPSGDGIMLCIPPDGRYAAFDVSLPSCGKDVALAHKVLLNPMVKLFCSYKEKDDSKGTNVEWSLNQKKASCIELNQKVESINAELAPLAKMAQQTRVDAEGARERSEGVRKKLLRLQDSLASKNADRLYSDGLSHYRLHVPQARLHVPVRKSGNQHVMARIRARFGGDLSIPSPMGDDPGSHDILKLLEKLETWEFDVTQLSNATGGTPLFHTCYYILHKHGLVQHFKIDHAILCNFLEVLEGGYHKNAYHNNLHAADVVHITDYILEAGGLKATLKMNENDCFAALVAAAIHDYDHPGLNNNFHIRTGSYLATLYNDRSVLENHHLTAIFSLIKNPTYNIFHSMSFETYKDIRDTIVEMVLSTDMGLHNQVLQAFQRRMAEDKEWAGKEDMRLCASITIKMADISNCCRPKATYKEWAKAIAAEFYHQGDTEERLGLPISPFMDRRKDEQEFPRGQMSFMNYVVVPLFEAAATLLPKMAFAVEQVMRNKADILNRNISS